MGSIPGTHIERKEPIFWSMFSILFKFSGIVLRKFHFSASSYDHDHKENYIKYCEN